MQNTGDAEMMDDLFKGFLPIIVYLLMVCHTGVTLQGLAASTDAHGRSALVIGGAFHAAGNRHRDEHASIDRHFDVDGIADKNAILLVDHMLVCNPKNGMPTRDAIVLACSVRAIRILMTSLAACW